MAAETGRCDLTSYHQSSDLFSLALSPEFRLAMSPFSPGGPAVLNRAAWDRWQAFAVPRPLIEKTDRILAQQQLIQPTDSRLIWQQPRPQTLTAWLHVTNACDLDCPYCYVRKSSSRMSEAVGRKAIKAVFDTAVSHQFRQVKLKYAGGEATLHFKMIRTLHALAQKRSAETGIGLTAVILTNGANLRPDDVAWIKENNIRIMVSLDGVGKLHDRLRSRRGGDGTFDRVAHTIDELLLPQGIRPYITMTITRANAHGAADLARWAVVERQLPVNFNLYRQNLLSASRQELALEEETIIAGLRAAYAVIEQALPDEPILGGLLDRVQAAAHTHTCGVGKNYVVITHTGRLAECHMRLEDATPLPRDLFASEQPQTIHNLTVDEKEGCRDCPFRYRCTGGCPLETYRATGRWDVKSPHCHIYKTLFPEVLRLQGLQLLKSNGFLERSN
ncbi:MAG TPA: SPASM domain-containing protein [Anaerolineae bacterium]|nr:SPASM domain-containing protein [Anaerolineae bacterium]